MLLQFKSILFRNGQERMFYILRITAVKVTLHLKKDWIKNLNNNFPLRVVFSLFSRCLICDETLYLVFDILRITSAIATHALRRTALKQLNTISATAFE